MATITCYVLDWRYISLYATGKLMAVDLIDQLNTHRLERRLTQPQLAKKLGVTFQTVNRWLNRHMKPNEIHEHHIRKLLSGGVIHTKNRRR